MKNWLNKIGKKLQNVSTVKVDVLNDVSKNHTRAKTALESYLAYYVGRQKPGYAVLVTGEWGAGKTFQVRRAIPEDKHYYVSLFGLQTTVDVLAAVFAAVSPKKARVKAETDANKGTSFWGVPIGAMAFSASGFFIHEKVPTDRTLIFDDLERCSIPPADLLGVINRYVEHHGCRVVVIAHEGKLENDLLDQREKLFGQTIKVVPDIDDAYAEFESEFREHGDYCPLREFRAELIGLFKESEIRSLRVLRHVMEDVVRLWRCMSEDQRNHREMTSEIVRIFSALSFEARSGRLTVEDFTDRISKEIKYNISKNLNKTSKLKDTIPKIIDIKERYKSTQFDSVLISDELICEMIFMGCYDPIRIKSCISKNSYFTSPVVMPSWKVFITFDQQTDADANDAMERLKHEFDNRIIVEPGEMLHTFALKMMMSDNGLSQQTISDVVTDCKTYIDDIRKSGKLKPSPLAWNDRESIERSYDGIAYWVNKKYEQEFQIIFKYLSDGRKAVLLKSLKGFSSEILGLMQEDGQRLYKLLNHTGSGNAKYADVPVLAAIDSASFVDTWMKSHSKHWYWIEGTIKERMKRPMDDLFDQERAWVKEIGLLMEAEAKKVEGIRALRIRRCIQYFIDEP